MNLLEQLENLFELNSIVNSNWKYVDESTYVINNYNGFGRLYLSKFYMMGKDYGFSFDAYNHSGKRFVFPTLEKTYLFEKHPQECSFLQKLWEEIREKTVEPEISETSKVLLDAIAFIEYHTPRSCGGCGTPYGNCDGDCVISASNAELVGRLRKLEKSLRKDR